MLSALRRRQHCAYIPDDKRFKMLDWSGANGKACKANQRNTYELGKV
jgi:hypothetical protein